MLLEQLVDEEEMCVMGVIDSSMPYKSNFTKKSVFFKKKDDGTKSQNVLALSQQGGKLLPDANQNHQLQLSASRESTQLHRMLHMIHHRLDDDDIKPQSSRNQL